MGGDRYGNLIGKGREGGGWRKIVNSEWRGGGGVKSRYAFDVSVGWGNIFDLDCRICKGVTNLSNCVGRGRGGEGILGFWYYKYIVSRGPASKGKSAPPPPPPSPDRNPSYATFPLPKRFANRPSALMGKMCL